MGEQAARRSRSAGLPSLPRPTSADKDGRSGQLGTHLWKGLSVIKLLLSLVTWAVVGLFWLVATRNFHPTWPLAIVATGSLVTVYAAASYVNHLVLVPRYLRPASSGKYALSLAVVMVGFTALGIAVLRTYYVSVVGLGNVNSLKLDFALDFFGMVVHVSLAAVLVWLIARFSASRAVSVGEVRSPN